MGMEKKNYKKQIIIVVVLVLLIAVFAFVANYMKQRALNKERAQKVEAMKKLNEESRNTPALPVDQKQKKIDAALKSLESQKNTVPTTGPVSQ